MVRVGTNNTGSVRFVNSAFWGRCNQIAKIAGKGTVGFSDCTFVQWDRNNEGRHALKVEEGNVLVRGCEFQENRPQVSLGAGVRRAVITGNIVKGKLNVANQSKGSIIVKDNASDAPTAEASRD
jgi:hypothetical protein